MSAAKREISIAYLKDFKDPTLLFWGHAPAFRELSAFLSGFSGVVSHGQNLTDMDWAKVQPGVRIWVEPTADNPGMSRSENGRTNEFVWRITSVIAKKFADMVDVLANTGLPGHQYLEASEADEVVVMVSKGEYDDLDPNVIR